MQDKCGRTCFAPVRRWKLCSLPVLPISIQLRAVLEAGARTLSTTIPPYIKQLLWNRICKKKEKEWDEMYFSNAGAVEEDAEESLSPRWKKLCPKQPMEQLLWFDKIKKKGRVVDGRMQHCSTRRWTQNIQTVELDFGWTSDESLDEEGIWTPKIYNSSCHFLQTKTFLVPKIGMSCFHPFQLLPISENSRLFSTDIITRNCYIIRFLCEFFTAHSFSALGMATENSFLHLHLTFSMCVCKIIHCISNHWFVGS